MELKDKIDYSHGQINKLEILSNAGGSVTLLAFDKGTELGTHKAPCDAMIMVIDGTADITLEGNEMKLKEGEFLSMRPGVEHSLKANKKFKVMITKINGGAQPA